MRDGTALDCFLSQNMKSVALMNTIWKHARFIGQLSHWKRQLSSLRSSQGCHFFFISRSVENVGASVMRDGTASFVSSQSWTATAETTETS